MRFHHEDRVESRFCKAKGRTSKAKVRVESLLWFLKYSNSLHASRVMLDWSRRLCAQFASIRSYCTHHSQKTYIILSWSFHVCWKQLSILNAHLSADIVSLSPQASSGGLRVNLALIWGLAAFDFLKLLIESTKLLLLTEFM